MLRKKGVVGKFVEFFGPGLDHLSLADRATIANMAPEYGATCGFFPVDAETLDYLTTSARSPARVALVEKYAQGAGPVTAPATPPIRSSPRRSISISPLSRRRWRVRSAPRDASRSAPSAAASRARSTTEYRKTVDAQTRYKVEGKDFTLGHGDVVIAAITSCTNTSNPSVLIGAGLLARNAVEKGIMTKPWVKTSLAPGSQVVAEYLANSGLQKSLDKLGFNLVGFGCTTCIGNSGPLAAGNLEVDQRKRHRRRGRALRQPQFRRPRQPRRAGQLSRLAAARRRPCAGRHGGEGSRRRAARPRQEGQPRLPRATSGRPTRKSTPSSTSS